jgi:hypothetical protein
MDHLWKITFAVVGLAMVSFAGWMAVDESEAIYSTDIDEYVPMPVGGAARFEDLRDLFKQELGLNPVEGKQGKELEDVRADADRYQAYLLSHREVILANYIKVQSILPNLRALAVGGPIGDTTVDFSSEIVDFKGLRSVFDSLLYYCELSAADPALKSGVEDLLLFNEMIRNWAPHTRSLVHSMISVVVLKQSSEAFRRCLPYLSNEQLEALRTQLQSPLEASDMIANVLWVEYCITTGAILKTVADERTFLTPFLFHPNRTRNIYGQHIQQTNLIAEASSGEALEGYVSEFERTLRGRHVHNPVGWLFLQMAIPAATKVYQTAHAYDDLQRDLLLEVESRLIKVAMNQND